jgi:small neutral amino acid transporter SnatA (MarC family)
MSGLLAIILLIVTVNPPRRRAELGEGWRVVAAGAGLTLVALMVLGGLGEWLLDGLDITAPTFRVAVGLVLLVRGTVDFVRSPAAPMEPPGGAGVPVFFPVLFRPELGLVAVSVAADAGFGPMALGTALGLALVVGAVARLDRPGYQRALGMVFSTALIVLAVDRVIDGVFAL